MKKMILFLCLFLSTFSFAKVQTIVSIAPQVNFVKAIGGNKVDITLMVEPGNSPHTYEPKPSLMRALSKADVYFSIGVEFEKAWLEKIFSQNRKLLHVNLSKGIEKIEIKEHSHEETEHEKHEENHDTKDPHIWTSPKNVALMAQTIYMTLKELDPQNSEYYKKNYTSFLKEIESLKSTLSTLLKEYKGRKFMVFHPSWGYFAKDYGLHQVAIEAGGKKPKAKHIIHIIKEVREENITAIITAPEFSKQIAGQIAKEAGVKVVALSPLAKEWSKNLLTLARTIANK